MQKICSFIDLCYVFRRGCEAVILSWVKEAGAERDSRTHLNGGHNSSSCLWTLVTNGNNDHYQTKFVKHDGRLESLQSNVAMFVK